MTRRAIAPHGGGDDGFTLIEVVVALILLGIVATGAMYFFINGTRTSSHLQRSQDAVAVANAAMERAYGIDPKDNVATGVPGLAVGRAQTDVDASFAQLAALGIAGVSDTYPVWDPTVSTSSGAALPIVDQATHSGQQFTVTTLVGACYRTNSPTATDQDCVKLSGYASEPATVPTGQVRMLRTIVVVTWDAPVGECGGSLCTYELSALVDQSEDLKWNQVIQPVAADDSVAVEVGGPSVDLDVLANDLVGALNSNPVSIISNPGFGTITSVSPQGIVTYRPPTTTLSGVTTFVYRVRDARGATADGTVTVIVAPKSTADSVSVLLGAPTAVNVLANDIGSPVSVQITAAAHLGSVSASGTTVTYTPGSAGIDAFTYTYTDVAGQVSPPASVTVNVSALTAHDVSVDGTFRPTSAEVWTELTPTMLSGTGDPGDSKVMVTGAPSGGTVRVDGVVYTGGVVTGSVVEFSAPEAQIGEWSFPFALKRGTFVTDVKTAVIRVGLTANDDTLGRLTRYTTTYIDVGANDSVADWSSGYIRVVPDSISCGWWSSPQDRAAVGQLRLYTGARTSGCRATYHLEGSGPMTGVISNQATIYYDVR
ncbi:MAG: prepilin-type N-terminal cleavage/methylation domain-containing protein [Actinomycetales bacterium]|nr:prepilin-type N-terminal cleavage/methylation domain-containing protein [Actinomycetales bacterium]